jgi:hypothetical protein
MCKPGRKLDRGIAAALSLCAAMANAVDFEK